ncbi:hypothetical protein BH11ARM2_BH11ARM2_28660 [soil metagenome]
MPLASAIALLAIQAAPIEVPFRIGEDAIIVDAVVNGRPVSCMFDTGFSGSFVLDTNLDIGKPTGHMTLQDFVGTFDAPTVKLKSVALGAKKIAVGDLGDVVQQPGDFSFSYNTHVDGIMGFDVIKDSVTEINFEKKKFIFYPKTVDISKRVPDNKKTFMAKMLPIGGNSMEMFVEAPSGKKMTLALDTGNAFYGTTHKDVLERVGLWPSGKDVKYMSSSGVASGVVDSFELKMPQLKIFGVPVDESYWSIIDLPSSSAEGDGTVGFGFLSNFNITLDYDRRRVWFENFTGKAANDAEGDVGISATLNPKTKRTQIVKVTPDSPASAAGIKEGDEVLSINDVELVDVGYRRFRKLTRGKVGEKVKFAISRRGMLTRYELERKSLVNTTD